MTSDTPPPPTTRRRLFWLVVCTLTGLGAGWAGHYFTESKSWFLAVPISIAVGWLFFANPAECLSSGKCRNKNDAGRN